MEKVAYKNYEEALLELNAKDRGRYYSCDCPQCGQSEAFISKKHPSFVNCNRKNNCGESTKILLDEKLELETFKNEGEVISLSQKQEKQLQELSNFFKYEKQIRDYYWEIPNKVVSFLHTERAITKENLLKSNIEILTISNLKHLQKIAPDLIDVKYAKDWATQRNVLFAFRNPDTGEIERIIARTTNKKEQLKEIQLLLKANQDDAVTFTEFGDAGAADELYVTESVLDGLSLLEVKPEAHVFALTGTPGVNRLAEYMNGNKQLFEHKKIKVLLDGDKAGIVAAERFVGLLELPVEDLTKNYKGKYYDLNDFLRNGDKETLLAIVNSTQENTMTLSQTNQKEVLENIFSQMEASGKQGLFIDTNDVKISYGKAQSEFVLTQQGNSVKVRTLGDEKVQQHISALNEKGVYFDEKLLKEVQLKIDDSIEKVVHLNSAVPKNQEIENVAINADDTVTTNPEIQLIIGKTRITTLGTSDVEFWIHEPMVSGTIYADKEYWLNSVDEKYHFTEVTDNMLSSYISIEKNEFDRIRNELSFSTSGTISNETANDNKRLSFENVKRGEYELSFEINEQLDRQNHNNSSFREYNAAGKDSLIKEYLEEFVSEFDAIVTPENQHALDNRLNDYNKLLVDLYEATYRANRIPSSAIVGSSNFPGAKKEKQNDRIHNLQREIYGKNGKRARFIENTEKMFDPQYIKAQEQRKEKEVVKVKEAGIEKSFFTEIEHSELAGFGVDYDAARVYIKTQGKPSPETRILLKEAGLRWSPKNTRWQRQFTPNALYSLETKLFKPLGLEIDRNSFSTEKITTQEEKNPVSEVNEKIKETLLESHFEAKQSTSGQIVEAYEGKQTIDLIEQFKNDKSHITANALWRDIQEGVNKAFSDPQTFKQHLEYATRLNQYSANNQALLIGQMTAEQKSIPIVNTFNGWKNQGVMVKKGAKAMTVIAPKEFKVFWRGQELVAISKATTEERGLLNAGKIETLTKTGFEYRNSVFHITQTNADIDKVLANNKEVIFSELDGNQKELLLQHLTDVAEKDGVLVMYRDLLNVKGTATMTGKKVIALNTRNTLEENITTFLHEFAHIELHRGVSISDQDAELQAEAIAYMFCKSELGLDNQSSFDYLASWSQAKDNKALNQNMKIIMNGYNDIKKKLNPRLAQQQNISQQQAIKQQAALQKNQSVSQGKQKVVLTNEFI